MALASSSGEFGTMNNKKKNNQQQRRPATGQGSKINLSNESNSSKLNFYESMYNFKKMFPLLESDVIEVVLRSNDGDVEKTIDQLLTLVKDEELARNMRQPSVETSLNSSNNNNNNNNNGEAAMSGSQQFAQQSTITSSSSSIDPPGEDQPPAYNEIFSTSRVNTLPAQSSNISSGHDPILDDWSAPVAQQSPAQLQSSIHVESTLNDVSSVSNASTSNSQSRREFWNRAMVGPLRKDFLRIRLTSDQIKKLKSNIKKAKRDEITAIVNNKTPQNPDLSFELKRKFTELTENLDANEDFYMDEWRSKYDELLNKYKARQERAMQDEYIAKLIHNEERLKSQQAASAAFNFEDNFSKLTTTDTYDDDESNAHSLAVKPASGKKKLSVFGRKNNDQHSHMSAGFTSLNNDDNISIASNGTSVSSRKEYDLSDDEHGYNINRIRQLEESGQKANGSKKLLNKNVFQSFKSVIKRNSILNSSIASSFGNKSKSSTSKPANVTNPFGLVDFNNNQDAAAVKNANDLIVFANDYTYDDPKPFARSSDFDLLVNTTNSRKMSKSSLGSSNGLSHSKNLLD